MSDANKKDLLTLYRWYGQAGTPNLTIKTKYDEKSKTFTMFLHQETAPTPKQIEKLPVLIPIKMALIDKNGNEIELLLKNGEKSLGYETVIEFDDYDFVYEFVNVHEKPVLSALRNFSAPVKMEIVDQTLDDLIFLFANDKDPFNKWDSGQKLCKRIIFDIYENAKQYGENYLDYIDNITDIPPTLYESFRKVLNDKSLDCHFIALALMIPTPSQLIGDIKNADPLLLYHICNNVSKKIACHLSDDFYRVMKENDPDPSKWKIIIKNIYLKAIR